MSSGVVKKLTEKVSRSRSEQVAVVRLDGPIGPMTGRGGGVSTESIEPVLKRAFETDRLAAVVIMIDSPGGSPAQSEYIAERIRQLAAEKAVPVLAFCESIAASGGYWIACAADEIFAARTSLVGSIGVVSSGFGLAELMSRVGVQRRLYSSGENKTRLDMFTPENAEDVAWLQGLQAELHEEFRRWVRQRRGKKLTASEEVLFNGDVWVGQKAAELGLVDGIGVMRSVIAERYPDAEVSVVATPKPLLARITGGQMSMADLSQSAVTGVIRAVDGMSGTRFR